jgi:catechol 2,3-dioxygenase-like lactoylglutathione lyase family enzyme
VDKNLVYHSCVLLVEDIERSKHFYNIILGQEIIMDFGRNVVFKGGLAIWERDYALNLIFQEKAKDTIVGASNFEVYFETENLYNLYKRLVKEKVKVIHSIREHPWGQRAFRAYDPDNHMIEFAESMESVVKRLNNEGLGIEEISKRSMMPIEFIKMVLKNCK